jgi:sec-independent protein translocase protein TatA
MGELSPWHWIIVLLIFALLFGSRRLPDAARGLGRSLRIFRAEMQGARDESPAPGAPAPVQDAVPPNAPQPAPADATPPVAPVIVEPAVAQPARPGVD